MWVHRKKTTFAKQSHCIKLIYSVSSSAFAVTAKSHLKVLTIVSFSPSSSTNVAYCIWEKNNNLTKLEEQWNQECILEDEITKETFINTLQASNGKQNSHPSLVWSATPANSCTVLGL